MLANGFILPYKSAPIVVVSEDKLVCPAGKELTITFRVAKRPEEIPFLRAASIDVTIEHHARCHIC
jgi:hypothetical protein